MYSKIAILAALLLASCGSRGTRPEDMSVAEHERAAAEAEAKAKEEQSNRRTAGPRGDTIDTSNPDRYWKLAKAHHEAAHTLTAREEAECKGVDKAARDTCPLATYAVADVQEIDGGVRVTYAGAEAQKLAAAVRCHAAHGAVVGREGMPDCPLYSKGLILKTEPVEGGAALILTSSDGDTVDRLRRVYVQTPAK